MVVKTKNVWFYESVEQFLEGWTFDIAIEDENGVMPMSNMSREEIFQHFGATTEWETFENALEKTSGKYALSLNMPSAGYIEYIVFQLDED